ncbi:MAG: radical SAM protein [Bacteroidales bacterium]|nr:radical SAM protein [Bacteroidales bacterium]
MQTILFHSTIFGPIHSRRLGTSLGINLSPSDGKVCSFDCVYCEAGLNAQGPGRSGLPTVNDVATQLEERLKTMRDAGDRLDVITFSGNGEPTLNPHFPEIIDEVIRLRDKYYPDVKISVLSNSTRLTDKRVVEALRRVDNNILKLDSAINPTMRVIDRPNSPSFNSQDVIDQIAAFGPQCIVQTMLLRGEVDGKPIDNTTPEEIDALIEAYKRIGPRQVMIYSLDRKTPIETLTKIPRSEMEAIAQRIREAGLEVSVS